jgi:hypothetical protein
MPPVRTEHLWEVLLKQAGLTESSRTPLADGAHLLLTSAQVPIAEPRTLTADDNALIEAIKAMSARASS